MVTICWSYVHSGAIPGLRAAECPPVYWFHWWCYCFLRSRQSRQSWQEERQPRRQWRAGPPTPRTWRRRHRTACRHWPSSSCSRPPPGPQPPQLWPRLLRSDGSSLPQPWRTPPLGSGYLEESVNVTVVTIEGMCLTLGHCLNLVCLSLGRQLDCSNQLLLLPLDLLVLDLNLLPSLHNLDLDLLIPDSLLDLGCLQFIRQLGLSFL